MALMYCPECSGVVSDTAETCPHCGFSLADFFAWIEHQAAYGYDVFEYDQMDRVPVRVLIKPDGGFRSNYVGYYVPSTGRLYAIGEYWDNYLLAGVVIPGVGVYLARVEEVISGPNLYFGFAAEQGKTEWYYGIYGEGDPPHYHKGLARFNDKPKSLMAMKVTFGGDYESFYEKIDNLRARVLKTGYLNDTFLVAIESFDDYYKNLLTNNFEERYVNDLKYFKGLDD